MSSEHNYRGQHGTEIVSRSRIIMNKNKTARIKLKPFEKINIYIIFMVKILADMTDRLYLYVDDRTSNPHTVQKMIDDMFNILRKFNVKVPDVVIRYTDYYETARVYLHRLVHMRKTLLNYNSDQRPDDLQTLLKTNKTKIFLIHDSDNMESRNRYDNILYDNGWFRDVFIEAIIDDAEKIDYLIDDIRSTNNNSPHKDKMADTHMSKTGDFVKINNNLTLRLCEILNFNRPEYVLTNLTYNIENLKHHKNNPIPALNDLSLDQIIGMGLGLEHVREMIENHDISLAKYIIYSDESHNDVFYPDTLTSDLGIQCMIDPVMVKMDETRTIDINGSQTQIKSMYMDKTEFMEFEKDTGLKNNGSTNFKIRFAGSMIIHKENDQYTCKWTHIDKKKKKSLKQLSKWIPCNDQIITYNFTCPDLDVKGNNTVHRIVIHFTKNISTISSYLLFKIKSNYYVRSQSNRNSLVLIRF